MTELDKLGSFAQRFVSVVWKKISTVPTGTVIMSVWEVNWQYMASFI